MGVTAMVDMGRGVMVAVGGNQMTVGVGVSVGGKDVEVGKGGKGVDTGRQAASTAPKNTMHTIHPKRHIGLVYYEIDG